MSHEPGGQNPPQHQPAPGPTTYATPGTPPPMPPPHQQGGQAPHQYGAQPPPAPPEPTKKSWFARHKFLTALLAIIAFIIVIAALSGGDDDGTAPAGGSTAAEQDAAADDDGADEEAAAEAAEDDAPAIGDAVRDGKFEFVVTDIEAGLESVGAEFLSEEAQGQFVLVHTTVSNIGDEGQTLYDGDQLLMDTEGRQHSANSMAGLVIEKNDTFFNEINPGNTVEGVIVFDIPTDAEPASLELHDSGFSGGVTVSLE